MKLSRFLTISILAFIVILFIPRISWARTSTGISCGPPKDQSLCPENTTCVEISSGVFECLGDSPSSLQKWQNTIIQNRESGIETRESWVGDPDSSILSDVGNGVVTMILGINDCDKEDCTIKGGAVSSLGNMIATVYSSPPASTGEYFAYLGRNLGIVKPVYAQGGVGFSGLRPILSLWSAFRNLAYVFFIIVFVITGFAIMFRSKIDPQTVISIQSAIPKIVIALILVTFSYAIAGLLIDLMYVLLYIPLAALVQSKVITLTESQDLLNQYMNADMTRTMGYILGLGWRGVTQFAGQFTGITATAGIAAIIAGILAFASGQWWAVAGMALPVILGLAIALLAFLFRILFSLIRAYTLTVVLIIFAPLVIVFGSLPGRGNGFSSWLRQLISNLAVFLITVYLLILCDIIVTIPATPPLWNPPLLSGGVNNLYIFFTLGVLMIIPNVTQLIQNIIEGRGPAFPEMTGAGIFNQVNRLIEGAGQALAHH